MSEPQIEAVDTENESRRDTIARLVADATPAEDTAPDPEPAPEPTEPTESPYEAKPAPVAAKVRDETGRFAPKPKGTVAPAPNGDLTAKTPPAQTQHTTPAKDGQPAPAAAPQALKAPQSWDPAEREHWAKLPPVVQQRINRREREVEVALKEAAPDRKLAQTIRETVAPFEGMIRAEGSEPMQAIGSLLQTAAALRTAPAHHKAQIVAQMIKAYGVSIETLDSILVGQNPQGQGQGQPAEYRDPRVDQLFGMLQQGQQQRATTLQEKAAQDIQAFKEKAEFVDDVSQDMADLLQVAHQNGRQLSLEDAYERACQLHPKIREIMQQRGEAERVQKTNANVQRSRLASSSIRGQPVGTVDTLPEPGEDRRSDIIRAMRKLSNR